MGIRRWRVALAFAGCGDDPTREADDAWDPSTDDGTGEGSSRLDRRRQRGRARGQGWRRRSHDVGLASAGRCLSKCDVDLLGGNGCRDGYGCGTLPRFAEAQVEAAVCVPEPFVPPATDCASQLDALGATWEPTTHEPESPEGYPDLLCTIDEPVNLYEPAPGLTLRYVDSDSPGHVLVNCQTASSIARSSAVAAEMGAVQFVHYGTYNCRPIAGTDTLSEHAFANAIDTYGFELDDGNFWTVIDHGGVRRGTDAAGWLGAARLDRRDLGHGLLEHHADARVQRCARQARASRSDAGRQLLLLGLRRSAVDERGFARGRSRSPTIESRVPTRSDMSDGRTFATEARSSRAIGGRRPR